MLSEVDGRGGASQRLGDLLFEVAVGGSGAGSLGAGVREAAEGAAGVIRIGGDLSLKYQLLVLSIGSRILLTPGSKIYSPDFISQIIVLPSLPPCFNAQCDPSGHQNDLSRPGSLLRPCAARELIDQVFLRPRRTRNELGKGFTVGLGVIA